MQLSHSEVAALSEELVRRAKQGDDKSVFGLLLLLEREAHAAGGCNVKVPIRKTKGASLLNQARPIVAHRSRYIE
ncbi:MAG TPA: hypothetical protein VK673_14695 [Chthoniobacterales bacterium]|nr:hypothetical protein [Chthoniobacterales bacterium]